MTKPGDFIRTAQGLDGDLIAGVNVDPVDIGAGLEMARQIGYSDAAAQEVTERALTHHMYAKEKAAQDIWLHEYPRDLTSWKMILAYAITVASTAMES